MGRSNPSAAAVISRSIVESGTVRLLTAIVELGERRE
jgi:hypothetical protein